MCGIFGEDPTNHRVHWLLYIISIPMLKRKKKKTCVNNQRVNAFELAGVVKHGNVSVKFKICCFDFLMHRLAQEYKIFGHWSHFL